MTNSLAAYQIKKYASFRLKPADLVRIQIMANLLPRHSTLLELGGCYPPFSQQLNQSHRLTSVDICPAQINRLHRLKISAHVCDLSSQVWPVPDCRFDAIICGDLIEHLLDTDFFLRQARRVLKPHGWLILSTPNTASLGRRLMLLFGRNPYFEANLNPKGAGHVRFFVKHNLFWLLEKHRFRVRVFTSDVINITDNFFLRFPVRFFPNLGKSLIIKAQKQ